MLQKLFGARKTKPPKSSPSSTSAPVEERSAALRIVHVGGRVESYYMAIPASRVMEKYPSFVLARPDIFRRPWEAVVRPEAILVPGQKFFVVPRRTVKKLRRRIRKPYKESSGTNSFDSRPLIDVSAEVTKLKDDFSSKSFLGQSDVTISNTGSSKTKGKKSSHPVFGLDTKQEFDTISKEKNRKSGENSKKSLDSQPGEGKRMARNVVTWQPDLTSIIEYRDSDE
ncbi:hypothetical protein Acr_23g0007480 [Actinidia rufa]|uniref:Uncharacterized protein n=1 Tax=Actinidia rufa TaxID=165716 RepID=A0A7J0GNL8_9ERIC|nr:hypothetical protein Acr_23g0007480 [Actinidia rufa]